MGGRTPGHGHCHLGIATEAAEMVAWLCYRNPSSPRVPSVPGYCLFAYVSLRVGLKITVVCILVHLFGWSKIQFYRCETS